MDIKQASFEIIRNSLSNINNLTNDIELDDAVEEELDYTNTRQIKSELEIISNELDRISEEITPRNR